MLFVLLFGLTAAPESSSGETPRSLGRHAGGALQGGVALKATGPDHYLVYSPHCYRRSPLAARYPDISRADNFYGHPKVVRAVQSVARAVRARHPEAPRLPVGELSNQKGGLISGHLSHQNGLDVDVYFPRETELARCEDGPTYEVRDPKTKRWHVTADFPRAWSWALVSEFAARRDVKVIFIGGLLRRELASWAKRHNVTRKERKRTLRKLHPVFCRPPKGVKPPFYRGNFCPHDDHIHVRFRCPKNSPCV